ncbi:MAG: MFS transporter [Legionellaceae bacterium]|nr:MFS transporter [Legionellaceae bacterium]
MNKQLMSWIVCLTAALFFFYEMLQLNMFNALGGSLMRAYGLSSTQLGWLSSAYFYANLIFLIPAGIILERFSTRRCLLIMCAVVIFSTVVFSLTHSFAVSFVCRALVGLGNCMAFLSAMKLASRWFDEKRLALAMGLIVTVAMLGGVVAQAPMAYLLSRVHWRTAVWAVGMLGAVIFMLMFLIVRDAPEGYVAQTTPESSSSLFTGLKCAMSSWSNWCCGLYMALLNLPLMILGALWGNLYLEQTRGLSSINAASITGMMFFGMIIGPPVIGLLSDKWQRRRVPMIVFAVLSLLSIISVMYVTTASVPLMMGLFLVLGILISAQTLSYPTLAATNPPEITSMAMTIPALCFNLSVAVAQPAFGWLMHLDWKGQMHHGAAFYAAKDYFHGFGLLIAAVVASAVLATMIKEPFAALSAQPLKDPLTDFHQDDEAML